MRIGIALKFLFLVLFASASFANERALILADEIQYTRPDRSFSAIGNVKVYFHGKVLHAQRLDYSNETVVAYGPLSFTADDGTVGIADFAELDVDFQNGVLTGVQMLIENEVNVVGTEVELVDGDYTRVSHAVVTVCRVCKPGQQPIWHFRSRNVVHDKDKRQLHLWDSSFYFGDVPLFQIPYLRLPDPTVDRQSGFLLPEIHYSSEVGLWTKIPYFQTLGDHADITWTPGFTSKGNLSAEIEHRRLFHRGEILVHGSLLKDRKHERDLRGHVIVKGEQDLGNSFNLNYSGELVTDADFLSDFARSTEKNLTSKMRVSRRSSTSWFGTGAKHVNRFGDDSGMIPHLIHDAQYSLRFSPAPGAGTVGLSLEAISFDRADVLARDVSRGSVDLDWQNSWVLDSGLVMSMTALAQLDSYSVKRDVDNDTPAGPAYSASRAARTAALEFRWPLQSVDATGHHVIEPFAQFVWSPEHDNSNIPNEDSILVEFDETNLLSLDRFAGRDRNEQGARLNLGFKHTGRFADGTSTELVLGRVFRRKDPGQFKRASGLAGKQSNYVAAGTIEFANGVGIDQRVVFDPDFGVTKGESFLRIDSDSVDLVAGYSRLLRDEDEDEEGTMTNDVESIVLFAEHDLGNRWAVNTSLEYDFNRDGDNMAGIGFEYRHQCLHVTLNAEHFRQTTTRAETDNKINLKLSLAGFSDLEKQNSAGCGA